MEALLIQISNVANALFLLVVIAVALIRLKDGAQKPPKEILFLLCIIMGAFMQLYPFPDPAGISWETVLFRLGLAGWSILAMYNHYMSYIKP